jgi:hypothetical protein
METVLDAVILAAEATAVKASGNDQNDWNTFANALRVARENLPKPPMPTPHTTA